MTKYTLKLIQAVNDWQRGGSVNQKIKRGAALKEAVAEIPIKFRQTSDRCYRQITLSEQHLRRVGTKYELLETVSSWTKCERIAKDFKGGVPAKGGYQAVIFSIIPPTGSVILDLAALYAEEEFQAAVEKYKDHIDAFYDGIDRYRNSQQEVIIEIDRVSLSALYCWGGYSSPAARLAEMFFCRSPSAQERIWFQKLMAKSEIQAGAYWLCTPKAVARVNERLKNFAKHVSAKPIDRRNRRN